MKRSVFFSLVLVYSLIVGCATKNPTIINVESVSIPTPKDPILVGATTTLVATVLPENAADKTVAWKSDKEAVATVDAKGVVTGVAAGTATITVTTTSGGKTATATVTVKANTAAPTPGGAVVAATGVTIVALLTRDIEVGKTTTIQATVLPENAADKTVTWHSDKADVATVVGGVVTGVNAGTAKITAKTANGIESAPVVITVKAAAPVITTTNIPATVVFSVKDGKLNAQVTLGDSKKLLAAAPTGITFKLKIGATEKTLTASAATKDATVLNFVDTVNLADFDKEVTFDVNTAITIPETAIGANSKVVLTALTPNYKTPVPNRIKSITFKRTGAKLQVIVEFNSDLNITNGSGDHVILFKTKFGETEALANSAAEVLSVTYDAPGSAGTPSTPTTVTTSNSTLFKVGTTTTGPKFIAYPANALSNGTIENKVADPNGIALDRTLVAKAAFRINDGATITVNREGTVIANP